MEIPLSEWKREKLKKGLLGELEGQLEAMLDTISDEKQMTLSEVEGNYDCCPSCREGIFRLDEPGKPLKHPSSD